MGSDDLDKLARVLTDIQREAVRRSVFIAGSWGLSDWNEYHPDVADHLSDDIACCISGDLTPLGLVLKAYIERNEG